MLFASEVTTRLVFNPICFKICTVKITSKGGHIALLFCLLPFMGVRFGAFGANDRIFQRIPNWPKGVHKRREVELIQTQLAHKPVLRVEVSAVKIAFALG